MSYLFFQILLCLLLASLLGLFVGWLLWGRRHTPAADPDCARDLDAARRRITALEADLQAARRPATPAPTAPPPAPAAPVDAPAIQPPPVDASATAASTPGAAAAGAAAGAVGLFGASADAPVDDLKRIDGIGPVIEKQLAGIGVTTFRQIARFSADDVAQVNEAIGVFQGRIEREDWIAQAARLHREDYGDDA